MIIGSRFDEDWTKTVVSRVFTRFFYDLAYWPSFLTRYDPYSNLTKILSIWSLGARLMKIGRKLWPLECSQGFSMIWPTDLVFDPTWLIFELYPNFIKPKHSDKFFMTIGCIMWPVLCSQGFFYHSTYWPSFWPDMTYILAWPRYCLDDHFGASLMKIGQKNCGL